MKSLSLLFSFFLIFSFSAFGQKDPIKKNSRPAVDPTANSGNLTEINAGTPVYFYEFENPKFLVSNIWIEHDENGAGKIRFQKNDFDEIFTEPLKLSDSTLHKIKSSWTAANFFDSNEKYQSEIRDYAHLGTVRLAIKRDQRERKEEFNWTENQTVKAIADEYRRIATQAIWIFDFNVARDNQPLRTPQMVKGLDSNLRRNAIADPVQIIPFLRDLSNDERVPLIARNHASRLVLRIESENKKAEKEKSKVVLINKKKP